VKRSFVTVAVAVLMVSVAPRSSEASPFVINLLTSSSSGGGSSHGAIGAGIPGFGGSGSSGSMPMLTLGARGLGLGAGIGSNGGPKGFGADSVARELQQIVTEARSVGATGFRGASSSQGSPGSPGHGSANGSGITTLNLGDGEYLTVSETVGESLVSSLHQSDESTTDVGNNVGGNTHGDATGGSGGSGGNSPNLGDSHTDSGKDDDAAVIQAVLPEIATDILFATDEISGSSGGESNDVSQLEIVSTPEPGSLLLLGSGLAVAARWMRGRKSGKS
jgi:hypothetical protein